MQYGTHAHDCRVSSGTIERLSGQQSPGLSLGTTSIDFPLRLDQDLRQAARAGVKLVRMGDDAEGRGIPRQVLFPEVKQISGV